MACGLCSRWGRCVVAARGECGDSGVRPWGERVVLGGAPPAPRPLQPFVYRRSLRLSPAEPRGFRAPSAPTARGWPGPALHALGIPRGAASLAVSHLCAGLLEATPPPHTVRPCPTGAAQASRQVSISAACLCGHRHPRRLWPHWKLTLSKRVGRVLSSASG